MIPLDVDRSSIPSAMFIYSITNPGTNTGSSTNGVAVHGWLGGAAQNAVGHDGTTSPTKRSA